MGGVTGAGRPSASKAVAVLGCLSCLPSPLSILPAAAPSPVLQGDGRYDPLRSLLQMAPAKGLPRYNFARSVVRGRGRGGDTKACCGWQGRARRSLLPAACSECNQGRVSSGYCRGSACAWASPCRASPCRRSPTPPPRCMQLRGLAAAEPDAGSRSPFDMAAGLLQRVRAGELLPSGPSRFDPLWSLLHEATLLQVGQVGVGGWLGGWGDSWAEAGPLHTPLDSISAPAPAPAALRSGFPAQPPHRSACLSARLSTLAGVERRCPLRPCGLAVRLGATASWQRGSLRCLEGAGEPRVGMGCGVKRA